MNATLTELVRTNGMAAVLAGLRQMVDAEARDLEDVGDPADLATVDALDAVASQILSAALAYSHIQE